MINLNLLADEDSPAFIPSRRRTKFKKFVKLKNKPRKSRRRIGSINLKRNFAKVR